MDDTCFKLPGYKLFRQDRTHENSKKQKGGGVAVYIKSHLRAEQVKPNETSPFEIIWIKIKVVNEHILCIVAYYPPDLNREEEFLNSLEKGIDEFITKLAPNSIILAGDFNNLSKNNITSLGLNQINFDKTRGQRCLDVFFTDEDPLKFTCHNFVSTVKSDHLGVILRRIKPKEEWKKQYFRDNRKRNREALGIHLDQTDFTDIEQEENLERATTSFINRLTDIYNFHCPLRTAKVRTDDPLFNDPLMKFLQKKKGKLERKGKTTEAEKVLVEIRKIIQNRSRPHTNRGGKDWWKQVNQLLGNTNSRNCEKTALTAEQLNAYFNSISKTTDTYQAPNKPTQENDAPCLEVAQVYYALKHLKATAPGPDDLPYWIYRDNAHDIAFALTHIFNRSLSTGVFPEQWKTAKITPIPKTSNATIPNEFRPIAVTPIIARTFERLVHKHYISKIYNNSLPPTQFGFRKGQSTTTALIKTLNDIHRSDIDVDYTRVITLDMSKAFDTISHQCIFEGLNGLTPPLKPMIINWCMNFLQHRKHYTQYGNEISTLLETNQGVPQGTVGAATFYNTGTMDISINDNRCSITTFADDNTPVIHAKKSEDPTNQILKNIEEQFKNKNLKLNMTKTKEIIIPTNAECPILPHVERKDTIKLLGIQIDSNLTFTNHIQTITRKANSAIYKILKFRALGYSQKDLEMLYNAYVKSLLEYGMCVWGGAQKTTLYRIDNIQRRAIRLGILRKFTPIKDKIQTSDERLYQEILEQGEKHPLYKYIPKRTDYASNRLRSRKPAVLRTKSNNYLQTFPNRLLKSF